MRKIFSFLLVVIAAALILTGAVLPRIVDSLRDDGGGVRYADMQSVRLDIGGDLTVIGKLVLMRGGEALDISESKASSSREEIEALAWKTLYRYQDAGLIAHFDDAYIQVRPTMSMDPQSPGFYVVTWAVIISNEGFPNNLVMMTIDDATGVVLSISYDTGQTWFDESEEAASAAVLWDLFFSGLGLDPTQIHGTDTGYELLCLLYDEAGGYVNIGFYVFSGGFYIDFT